MSIKAPLRHPTIIALLIFFLLSPLTYSAIISSSITPNTMDTLLYAIDDLFFDSNKGVPLRKFLRVAFHDCMGGCDSRVNLQKSENRGLEGVVTQIYRAYLDDSNPFKNTLSRPDFMVLCELRALAWGIRNGGSSATIPVLGPDYVVYKYGRTNSTAEPFYDDVEPEIPSGVANWTSHSGPISVLESISVGLKGVVVEHDLVALLGLHNTGGLHQNNSGFQGPWGQTSDRDAISNGVYKSLMGWQMGSTFDLEQTHSYLHNGGRGPKTNYYSPPPEYNKLQWTRVGQTATSRVLINIDMGILHNFTSRADGTAPGKYCPQRNNLTLFDCSQTDPSYMPLSSRAAQAYSYITNSTLFYSDLIAAFLKLTSVPSEMDSEYFNFRPEYVCENGVAVCRGDVLLQGCAGFPQPC